MNRARKTELKQIAYVIPSLIGVIGLVVVPLLDVLRRSFMNGNAAKFTGLMNYRQLFSNKSFQLAVRNTLIFDAVSIPLIVFLSLLFAYAVTRMKNNFLKFVFVIPMAIPSNALVTVWKMLFDDAGIINGILSSVDIAPVHFLTGKNSMYLLIGTYIWKNMGYNMLIWFSALSAIPENIHEAAKLDGAGSLKIFTRVVCPNLRGAIYMVAVLSVVNSFKVFRDVFLLAGSYPDKYMYMLQHLFNNWFIKLSMNKLAAASCLTAICLFTFLLILRLIIRPYNNEEKVKKRGGKNKEIMRTRREKE